MSVVGSWSLRAAQDMDGRDRFRRVPDRSTTHQPKKRRVVTFSAARQNRVTVTEILESVVGIEQWSVTRAVDVLNRVVAAPCNNRRDPQYAENKECVESIYEAIHLHVFIAGFMAAAPEGLRLKVVILWLKGLYRHWGRPSREMQEAVVAHIVDVLPAIYTDELLILITRLAALDFHVDHLLCRALSEAIFSASERGELHRGSKLRGDAQTATVLLERKMLVSNRGLNHLRQLQGVLAE